MIVYLVVKVYPESAFDNNSLEPLSIHKYRIDALDMADKANKILRSYPVDSQFRSDDDFMDACHEWETKNFLIDPKIERFEMRKVPMNKMLNLQEVEQPIEIDCSTCKHDGHQTHFPSGCTGCGGHYEFNNYIFKGSSNA